MKICPNCQQRYDDDNLNFCLNDGGVLANLVDEGAPTINLNKARTTDQNWSYTDPNSAWQTPPAPTPMQPYNPQQPQLNQQWTPGRDQTLPIISLVLGVLSLSLVCCWGGFYFGIAAIITGYIGINNARTNPERYTGKEMAIGGLVLGAVSLAVAVLFVVLAILGNIS